MKSEASAVVCDACASLLHGFRRLLWTDWKPQGCIPQPCGRLSKLSQSQWDDRLLDHIDSRVLRSENHDLGESVHSQCVVMPDESGKSLFYIIELSYIIVKH